MLIERFKNGPHYRCHMKTNAISKESQIKRFFSHDLRVPIPDDLVQGEQFFWDNNLVVI